MSGYDIQLFIKSRATKHPGINKQNPK